MRTPLCTDGRFCPRDDGGFHEQQLVAARLIVGQYFHRGSSKDGCFNWQQ